MTGPRAGGIEPDEHAVTTVVFVNRVATGPMMKNGRVICAHAGCRRRVVRASSDGTEYVHAD